MKVTMIEGSCVTTETIKNFSIDGVIDHFDIDNYDVTVSEELTANHRVIIVHDYDGEAIFLIGNR